MNIRILSDGKPGHLSQTTGLAKALVELAGGTVTVTDLSGKSFGQRIATSLKRNGDTSPDVIIAAGHHTHIPLLLAAKRFKALSIVCMKPSLPSSLFDLCVVPRHDMPASENKKERAHIFETIGALNGIRPASDTPKTETLILIGGPSGEFDWDLSLLIPQLAAINRQAENAPLQTGDLILTTSRRTPPDVARAIQAACPAMRVIPVEQTKPGWVAQHLSMAKAVWVTEDSVSMVYEALSSGAPVGILSIPRNQKKKSSRVSRGLEMLIDEKRVTRWSDWVETSTLEPQPAALSESLRTAKFILSRFPQLARS